MFRFIHAADVHLDSPLKGLERYEGAPHEQIRHATRRALENLVELALERQVDFVLIAGDLYDGDWRDHNTGLFFVKQMARLREAEIPVVMVRGNHDAQNKMTHDLPLPENVETLSCEGPSTATANKLRDLGVAVHGRSFARPAETENLAAAYPQGDRSWFNIGLLHTSLTGDARHDPYAPCSIDDLLGKGYQYWALGHIHQRETKHADPFIRFSGNTQGRHVNERGAKGCLLVTADPPEVQVEFHSLDVFRWELCRVDAEEAAGADDVLESFAAELRDLIGRHDGLPLAVRVVIQAGRPGGRGAPLFARPEALIHKLRAVALDHSNGRVWIEQVRCEWNHEDRTASAPADDPLNDVVQYFQQLRGDEAALGKLSQELASLRRKLPPELLAGPEALDFSRAGPLRRILDDAESLLESRMMSREDAT